MSDEACGKWMPRSRAECARPPGHNPPCKTPVAVEADRRRAAERRAAGRKDDPEVKQRYNTAYRLAAYGLTPERFYVLLAGQGFACGMCHEKFADGQRVCVDHDHGCCKTEKRCCGKCVRGLQRVAGPHRAQGRARAGLPGGGTWT